MWVSKALDDWESRMHGRLSVLPDTAEPLQRAQLMAALSVGGAIIQLCSFAQRLNMSTELDESLGAMARGNSAVARPRACVLAMSQALTRHAAYFDRATE
jgi:hypothetical protein